MTSHPAQPDSLPTALSLFAGVGSQKVWCFWGDSRCCDLGASMLVRRSWCVTLPITLRLENTICPENSVVIGFMGCSGAAARFGVVIGAAMAYVIDNAVMNISLGKR